MNKVKRPKLIGIYSTNNEMLQLSDMATGTVPGESENASSF